MKSIIKSVCILILPALFSCQLFAQVNVIRITDPDALTGRKGIVYNLPRTQVHIGLIIKKTEYIPGPLAAYAADYLGVNGVSDKNKMEYAILSANARTSTEPDPDQYYLIQKEEKSSGEIWISFGKHAPVNVMEKFPEEAFPLNFTQWNSFLFQEPDAAKLFRKYTESPSREIVDTIVRKVSIDTIAVESAYLRHSMVEFSDKEKAREAVERIRQIENDQYNLLIGYPETAYSKDALELMLSRLENQRQEYVRLFTGVILEESLNFEFSLLPDPENEDGEYVIAGFSDHAGIVEPNGQNAIKFSIRKKQEDKLMMWTGDQEPPVNGLAYRIPSVADIAITYNDKQIATDRLMILQFSPVLRLPPDVKRVEFDPLTGALTTAVME